MEIYLNAFRIVDVCPSFDLAMFASNSPEFDDFKAYGRHRAMTVGRSGDYLVGLLASSTGQNKDVLLTYDDDNKPHLAIRDTSGIGERLAFNFFAINVKTGMGLVSRYYSAGSVVGFGRVIRNRYFLRKRTYRDMLLEELAETDDDSGEQRKKIRSDLAKGTFRIRPVYRPGTFEQLVSKFGVITELTYDEPDVKDQEYKLVRDQLTLDRRHLKFEVVKSKKRLLNQAKDKIVKFIKQRIIERGVEVAVVHGKSTTGESQPPVTISPDVDSFGSFPYNEIVTEENLTLDAIAAAPFIKKMLAVARQNSGIFETPTS